MIPARDTPNLQSRTDAGETQQEHRPDAQEERTPAKLFAEDDGADLAKPGEHAQPGVDPGLGRGARDTGELKDEHVCLQCIKAVGQLAAANGMLLKGLHSQ